jgi:hypothetical protein
LEEWVDLLEGSLVEEREDTPAPRMTRWACFAAAQRAGLRCWL